MQIVSAIYYTVSKSIWTFPPTPCCVRDNRHSLSVRTSKILHESTVVIRSCCCLLLVFHHAIASYRTGFFFSSVRLPGHTKLHCLPLHASHSTRIPLLHILIPLCLVLLLFFPFVVLHSCLMVTRIARIIRLPFFFPLLSPQLGSFSQSLDLCVTSNACLYYTIHRYPIVYFSPCLLHVT